MPAQQFIKFVIVQNEPKANPKNIEDLFCNKKLKWSELLEHSDISYMGFQEEKGLNAEKHHLQGFVVFKTKKTFTAVKKFFDSKDLHVEQMKGSIQQSIDYCSKSETKIGDYYSTKGEPPVSKSGARTDIEEVKIAIESRKFSWEQIFTNHFKVCIKYRASLQEYYRLKNVPEVKEPSIILRPYQNVLLAAFKNSPQERRIFWCWSEASKTGKTTFCKYVCSKYKCLKIPFNTSLDNIIYQYNSHSVIWFEVSRSFLKTEFDVFVGLLESLSDGGLFTSAKYEGNTKNICAHIVVTANQPPPFESLPERIQEVSASIQN